MMAVALWLPWDIVRSAAYERVRAPPDFDFSTRERTVLIGRLIRALTDLHGLDCLPRFASR